MPRPKASKKTKTSSTVPEADTKSSLNEENIIPKAEEAVAALSNGKTIVENEINEKPTTKSKGGRAKKQEKSAAVVDEEVGKKDEAEVLETTKKPTRGKGKKINEVVDEEVVVSNVIEDELQENEPEKGKKSQTKGKAKVAKEDKKDTAKATTNKRTKRAANNDAAAAIVENGESQEVIPEEVIPVEVIPVAEKKSTKKTSKNTSAKNKKNDEVTSVQELSKKVENTEEAIAASNEKVVVEASIVEAAVVEAVELEAKPKGRGKKAQKVSAPPPLSQNDDQEEPPKKKGRQAAKTPKIANNANVNDEKNVENLTAAEAKPAEEQKPMKRGRAAAASAKANSKKEDVATETLEIAASAAVAEVVPKKRSRKEPSVEKEIPATAVVAAAAAEEKPKKGRAKRNAKEPIAEVKQEAKPEEMEIVPQNGDAANLETIEEAVKEEASSKATAKGRKRAAPSSSNKNSKQKASKADVAADDLGGDNEDAITQLDDEENEAETVSKPSKSKKKEPATNGSTTVYNKADFELPALPESASDSSEIEPRYNLKISSWNVAGLRAWLKKDGLKFLEYEEPDIFCLQETKCTTDQLPEEVAPIAGYHPYWLCMPGGHAGVAIYSKIMPINVEYGIGNKEFDDTGRIITAEYEKFYLVNVYVPNSGRKLVNLEPRMRWEKLFQQFIEQLNARKPVIICGDMNVSHQEIDLANPKTNTKNAGFTKEEREKMTELLALGYIDTYRHLYPDRTGAYTFWTYMGNARSRNVGWRLDYFLVAERLVKKVVDNCIRSQCMGSDHCPITLFLKL